MKAEFVSSKDLAAWLGVTPRRVQQLVKAGTLVPVQDRPLRFDLQETVRNYVTYLSEKAQGREEKDIDAQKAANEKLRADADYKMSRARMAELELAELEGRMHRSEDVQAVFEDFVFTVRHAFMALPGRLAMDVAQVGSAAEASVLIRSECNRIMEELSGYVYDPDAYASRVRERRKWENAETGEGQDQSSET